MFAMLMVISYLCQKDQKLSSLQLEQWQPYDRFCKVLEKIINLAS